MIHALTVELGLLVADATGLPCSIDPIRPPSIPGAFVGPPSFTPDTTTGGRVLRVQWETGLLVTATPGAWESAAELGELVTAAVVDHPTLGLVQARSMLWPAGDSGEAPGYRVDVALLVLAGDLGAIATPTELVDELAT